MSEMKAEEERRREKEEERKGREVAAGCVAVSEPSGSPVLAIRERF